MTHHGQHSEWVLDLAIRLDEHHAGFCGAFLRASAEKRQVIAAYLANRFDSLEKANQIALFLLSADHRTILSSAHGEQVEGLRGALRRSGPTVHKQRFYCLLGELLASSDTARRKCIARLPSLDLTKLHVIGILPPSICRANVVQAIDSVDMAKDVATTFELFVSRGVDREELAAAIRQVKSQSQLLKVFQNWVLKCRAPEHPVKAGADYRPILTGAELARMARRYRNCARTYSVDLLDDQDSHAFAEARYEGEGVIVHLRQSAGKWRLAGLFGRSNKRPSLNARAELLRYLAKQGIVIVEEKRPPSKWEAVRRIAEPPMEFGMW